MLPNQLTIVVALLIVTPSHASSLPIVATTRSRHGDVKSLSPMVAEQGDQTRTWRAFRLVQSRAHIVERAHGKAENHTTLIQQLQFGSDPTSRGTANGAPHAAVAGVALPRDERNEAVALLQEGSGVSGRALADTPEKLSPTEARAPHLVAALREAARFVSRWGQSAAAQMEFVGGEPGAAAKTRQRMQGAALQRPLAFLHIPKNAGTAIENAGDRAGMKWGGRIKSLKPLLEMPDKYWCRRYHVPPSQLQEADLAVYRNSDVFCVTRHPYERAVSEYLYLLSVEWAGKTLFLYDQPACTTEGLNYFLQRTLRRFQAGWRYATDCHMLPQSEYIWGADGRKWCQHVLRTEELPRAFDNLMEARGSSVRLGSEKENSVDGVCPGMTPSALADETKSLLNAVYAEDFRRLGYEQRWGEEY